MSLGRTPTPDPTVRDERADYINAYLEELESYQRAGMTERANAVVVALRELGHEVDKSPIGVKERAVTEPPLETAVPSDEAPKRRGRPRKATEDAD